MNHLDLCSGIGGWALAFRELDINTVAFCEIDDYPQKVLKKNFPGIPIFNDLKELTYGHIKKRTGVDCIDLVTCSYPCQPFSVAGKQKGEEDPRHLWPDTFRIVQECKPTWFVGENVSGHIKLGLDNVLQDLASIGYDTRTFVIPASSLGAWHQRKRIWIVGYSEHNGSLASEKSRRNQEAAGRSSQGQNQAEQFEGTSRPRNHENVSDTDNSRDRTSRHEVNQEQPQTDQGWQEQPQSELSRHSKNVPNTDSRVRGRGRTEQSSGAYPQWQFYSEEEEQTRQHIRSEVERCDVVLGETEDVSDTKSEGLSGSRGQESNTNRARMEQRKGQEQGTIRSKSKRCGGVSTDVSDTDQQRTQVSLEGQQSSIELSGSSSEENWWQTESELCGVPDGVSYGLDKGRVGRIKGLGNAIVPQIAWFIGNAIVESSDNFE
tara:strand:- start:306 stop:1604 length:1299 start_codon:yes stop_codon:yes gene_type:complete